jgi:hypothetical protein
LSNICRRIFFRQRVKSTHLYERNINSPAKRRSKNADGKKQQWDKRSTEKTTNGKKGQKTVTLDGK